MIEVGASLGVEEEYHLVDAETLALADVPDVVPEALRVLGAQAHGEISTSQLEIATTCTGAGCSRLIVAAGVSGGTGPAAAGVRSAPWRR